MFLSTLFCRKRAACQQGTKSAREERKPFLVSHHHCLALLEPGHEDGGIVGRVKCCLDTGGEADGAWLGREGTGLGTAQHAQEIQSNSQQTCWVWHTTHLSLSFSISVPLKTSPYTCYGHLLKPEYVSKRSPILWPFLDTFLNRKLQRLQ